MQPRRLPRWWLAAALLASGVPCAGMAAPSTVEGVARVIDGDTLELAGERIRLWGIDAPERSQTCRLAAQAWRCGEDAARALDRLLKGRAVRCKPQGRDRYSRLVAVCMAAGSDIGAAMAAPGLGARLRSLLGWSLSRRAAGGVCSVRRAVARPVRAAVIERRRLQPSGVEIPRGSMAAELTFASELSRGT